MSTNVAMLAETVMAAQMLDRARRTRGSFRMTRTRRSESASHLLLLEEEV